MSVVVGHEPDSSRFVATLSGARVGLVDYRVDGDVVTVTHTETDPAHAGQGIAGELTRAVVEWIADTERRLVPQCPYTANWIRRHPEHEGLLA